MASRNADGNRLRLVYSKSIIVHSCIYTVLSIIAPQNIAMQWFARHFVWLVSVLPIVSPRILLEDDLEIPTTGSYEQDGMYTYINSKWRVY